ncbi:MAG: hypothetical protein IIA14_13675 [SAR324 cluster bacterium]|nr:hypothetical protein [SAR324 cluster bacterium]
MKGHGILVALALISLMGSGLAFAHPPKGFGPELRGGGMPGKKGFGDEQMGPGMMDHGRMGPGRMAGMALLYRHYRADLGGNQREQLKELMFETRRAMFDKMEAASPAMQELRASLNAFPVDQAAVRRNWQALNKTRQEMFELRLATMQKVQKIFGKELWEDLQGHVRAKRLRHGRRR